MTKLLIVNQKESFTVQNRKYPEELF